MHLVNKLLVATIPLVPRSLVRRFAGRYIAGEEIVDAVRVVRELNRSGAMATLDVLGEDIHNPDEAEASKRMILRVLDTIRTEALDSNVSIKLTQLGLRLNRDSCLGAMREIVARAASLGNFIRIDMEDSAATDDTLAIYRALRKDHGNVGIVLQAYLRRTEADAAALQREGLGNFRLCKGIYIEPAEIAYKDRAEINEHFLRTLETMLSGGAYVGIATHDHLLVEGACRLIKKLGLGRDKYEFQMLLGVLPELRAKILADGHRLRVYVPFGSHWYQYSIRRFKENPQVAGNVLKALFTRQRQN
jgi:proline dehydrogenase